MSRFWTPTAGCTGARGVAESGDTAILRPCCKPFETHGGLRALEGNLGKAIVKTSALKPERLAIEGEVRIFHCQEEMHRAFWMGSCTAM